MQLTMRWLVPLALALTVIPGLKTISRAANTPSGVPLSLPSCAEPALFAAIQGSGCAATDAACICSNPKILSSLESSIQQACSPADQAAVEAFGDTYCGRVVSSFSAFATTTAGAVATAPGVPIVTDTSSVLRATTTSSTKKYSRTMTYSTTATSKPTNVTAHTGGAVQLQAGLGGVALAVAIAGMSWVFAAL